MRRAVTNAHVFRLGASPSAYAGRLRELIFANCLVPVSPQRPQIEYAGAPIQLGSNVTARAGEIATLTCTSRYGNPAPLIKWFVIVVLRLDSSSYSYLCLLNIISPSVCLSVCEIVPCWSTEANFGI